ncbi:MAG: hypothetical protein AB8B85_07815 [Paracoccaceae bacterium]
MLSGAQLATAISAMLILSVAVGWGLHWLWVRLSNAAISDTARITEMINRLHEADRAREAAEDAKELAENILASREAEMENRMAAMQHRLDGAVDGREAQLLTAMREAKAEADAAMGGLRNARARIMDLEAEVEELRQNA